jgi:hypothetical protein
MEWSDVSTIDHAKKLCYIKGSGGSQPQWLGEDVQTAQTLGKEAKSILRWDKGPTKNPEGLYR